MLILKIDSVCKYLSASSETLALFSGLVSWAQVLYEAGTCHVVIFKYAQTHTCIYKDMFLNPVLSETSILLDVPCHCVASAFVVLNVCLMSFIYQQG